MSNSTPGNTIDAVTSGRRVLEIEARAISEIIPRLGAAFEQACAICHECRGRIVVTGMGKSGHIAGKLAATLASTGTPAFFVHAGEASHGDLGMITGDDVVLAISNSGETNELSALLPTIRRMDVPLISMTGKAGSTLARAATVNLDISVPEEACPLNLAPTASTTATLALGDALAVVLLELRGFTEEDFALSHPGGRLGRRLTLRVGDIMRSDDDIPVVRVGTALADALLEISQKGMGFTIVVDDNDSLAGVFTDGDLRRALDTRADLHQTRIEQVMIRDCQSVTPQTLAAHAVDVIEDFRITALPVIDEAKRVCGALNVHDLLRAGVM
ncbi:MAG: SIS domain-containing protein [Gammaproteobacteria bacterium]